MDVLHLYNTLLRDKTPFEPMNPPFVGLYVCGPTVYGDAHLGHARPAITFDVVFRYLRFLGYRVRYVRNITDVGHLQGDADEGEDKIQKQSRLEQLEPMEVAQRYMDSYSRDMDRLNILRPSIEPRATGHIPEQIEMIQDILRNGFAYEVNGSVYFDVQAYSKEFRYGALSNRNVDDMLAGSRDDLEGINEKRHPADFALWKKADPNHLMRWNSPWGEGFPGWHIECSAMSTKYLGKLYDIHGGGLDLIFPHHEAEIAQSNACNHGPHFHDYGEAQVWMHCNFITINGQKMAKSLGNGIKLSEFFSGEHTLLEQAYSPMNIRFFILQAHYRSTLDFSNEALQASGKAFARICDALSRLDGLKSDARLVAVNPEHEQALGGFLGRITARMNDDLNTAQAIAEIFDVVPVINQMSAERQGPLSVNPDTLERFRKDIYAIFEDVLGLKREDEDKNQGGKLVDGLLGLIANLRIQARKDKNFAAADQIRDELAKLGIQMRDTPQGAEWTIS